MIKNFLSTGRPSLPATLVATAAVFTALSACVLEPGHPRLVAPEIATSPRFATEVVTETPPPPREEVVGFAPERGYVWRTGYWNWENRRHVWVAGQWIGPREGYYWEPHVWVHAGEGWRLREGYWAKR